MPIKYSAIFNNHNDLIVEYPFGEFRELAGTLQTVITTAPRGKRHDLTVEREEVNYHYSSDGDGCIVGCVSTRETPKHITVSFLEALFNFARSPTAGIDTQTFLQAQTEISNKRYTSFTQPDPVLLSSIWGTAGQKSQQSQKQEQFPDVSLEKQFEIRPLQDQLLSILRDIEADASIHYRRVPVNPSTMLSLTKTEFTSLALSQEHLCIRQNVIKMAKIVENVNPKLCSIALLRETTNALFARLLHYVHTRTSHDSSDDAPSVHFAVASLMVEVCLFAFQKFVDREEFKKFVT